MPNSLIAAISNSRGPDAARKHCMLLYLYELYNDISDVTISADT